MSLPACPDCGSTLGRNAHKCRCGWVSKQEGSAPLVECAYGPSGCVRRAQIRRKTPTGWANVCLVCDQRMHQEQTEKWCTENGLITTQQKIDYCRAQAKKMFRGVRFDDREPGQDDERAAA